MSDILCIYYSRTGNTKKAMEEIAAALDAELVELRDGVDRSGWRGWLRCGLDAMRKSTRPVAPLETARPLGDYRLVILGTPVWAGRCSAVMRSFLKEHGGEICRTRPMCSPAAAGPSTRRSTGRWICMCPPATRRRCPCAAGTWAVLSGRRSFSARSGPFWRGSSGRPFLKSTGEERPHAGKTEGAGPAV